MADHSQTNSSLRPYPFAHQRPPTLAPRLRLDIHSPRRGGTHNTRHARSLLRDTVARLADVAHSSRPAAALTRRLTPTARSPSKPCGGSCPTPLRRRTREGLAPRPRAPSTSTLVDRAGRALPMPSAYDEIRPAAHRDYAGGSARRALTDRALLEEVMARPGFVGCRPSGGRRRPPNGRATPSPTSRCDAEMVAR